MIPKGLFTQIGMMIVAVAIIITYIKPAFTDIGDVQDNIELYKTEREKVSAVNQKLSSLVSRLQSVSNEDQHKLDAYLPSKIDEIKVQRDLLLITQEAGVLYNGSGYEGLSSGKGQQSSDGSEILPIPHSFSLSVEGTYDQMKNLFSLIEQNNYPLEVHSLNVTSLEGDFLSAEISLITYTLKTLATNG